MYDLLTTMVKNHRFPKYETLSRFGDRMGLINNVKARHLATSSKRLDLCAAQFAQLLHLAGRGGFEGKVCLEIGSGWVLSHAMVCHLLGAKRVIATDIYPMAHQTRLYESAHQSIAYFLRDILAPFSDHERLRERVDRLLSIKHFSTKALNELGIYYQAPFDFAKSKYDQPVDFIWSLSVLSHLPGPLVEPI